MDKKPFYITTTLPYVNAEPHLGHAMEFIRADIIARWKKLAGYDVFFNTGSDEHGQKVFQSAERAGKAIQAYVDELSLKLKGMKDLLGLSEDIHFIRTTDLQHIKAAEEFWKRVAKNGFIYKKNYKAKYCVGCEAEKTDSELVDGKCPIHHTVPEIIEEENYFFKFSLFGTKLLNFYDKIEREQKRSFIVPSFRLNEMREFIAHGLEDFSISRLKSKMSWGVPVPGDADHVMYVWFDALVSYISTLGWPDDTKTFERFWVNGTPTQYCGKDMPRFQAVMWQAMLMAAELPNTYQIIVNGFVTGEHGIKMSKTLGNVVSPKELVDGYGTEALRYFFAREVQSFEDSPFTAERFKEAYNAGLANGLGNLVSRVMKMAMTNLEGPVTIPVDTISEEYKNALNSFDIQAACNLIWKEVAAADLLIQEKEPFKLVKTDKAVAVKIIQDLCVRIYKIAGMLEPILPNASMAIKSLVKENKMPDKALFARKE